MKTNTQTKQTLLIAVLLSALFVINPAFAQGKIGTTLTAVITLLNAAAIVAVTTGIMFAGFGMVFQGKQFRDVMPICVGALVIGGAAQAAALLIT